MVGRSWFRGERGKEGDRDIAALILERLGSCSRVPNRLGGSPGSSLVGARLCSISR